MTEMMWVSKKEEGSALSLGLKMVLRTVVSSEFQKEETWESMLVRGLAA